MANDSKTVYDFSFKKTNGEEFKLSPFQGKVLLIVNTASQCVFTKQYAALEELYLKFQKRGLVVIGVPSDDFGNQEPGSDGEIQQFCTLNFNVTFPVVKKESVTGIHAHPFYAWAKGELGFGSAPKWNFHKYLIDRDGRLVNYFNSFTSPSSPRMVKAIEALLDKQPKS